MFSSLFFIHPICRSVSASQRPSTSPLVLPVRTSPPSHFCAVALSPSLLLTCNHCVRNAQSISSLSNPLSLVSHDIACDLALLKPETPLRVVPAISFPTPQVGQKYEVHDGRDNFASLFLIDILLRPLLASAGKVPVLVMLDQHDAVGEGWSGAAVFDEDGGVVGVIGQVMGREVHVIPGWFIDEMKQKGHISWGLVRGGAKWQRDGGMLGVKDEGIRIISAQGGFEEDDRVVKVGGRRVGTDGKVQMRPGLRLDWRVVHGGSIVEAVVERKGQLKIINADVVGMGDRLKVKKGYEVAEGRTVVVSEEGILFGVLSVEYLKMFGDSWMITAPNDLVARGMEEGDEDIVIVLGFKCGDGAEWEAVRHKRVVAIDGEDVIDLNQMVGQIGVKRVVEFGNGWKGLVGGGELDEFEGWTTEE